MTFVALHLRAWIIMIENVKAVARAFADDMPILATKAACDRTLSLTLRGPQLKIG